MGSDKLRSAADTTEDQGKNKKSQGGEKRSSGSTQAKKKYGQSRVCIPESFTTRESVRGKALQQKWMDGESLDNTEERKKKKCT
jgi:hypothetical protein